MTATYPERFACELSASIFWATVMRGTISMLMALTPAPARRSTICLSLNGSRKLIWMQPWLQQTDFFERRLAHAQDQIRFRQRIARDRD